MNSERSEIVDVVEASTRSSRDSSTCRSDHIRSYSNNNINHNITKVEEDGAAAKEDMEEVRSQWRGRQHQRKTRDVAVVVREGADEEEPVAG